MLGILEYFSDIVDKVTEIWNNIAGMFSDVNFSILYDWLPADVQAVCAAVIAAMVVLALIGLVKRTILFLG